MYFQGLIDAADQQTPFFGLVRSMGKLGWFKTNLRGHHILLVRSPAEILHSILRLRYFEGIDYFFDRTLETMHYSSALTPPGSFGIGVPVIFHPYLKRERQLISQAFATVSPRAFFRIFAQLYFSHILRSLSYTDAVIDLAFRPNDLATRIKAFDLNLGPWKKTRFCQSKAS